MSGVIGADLDAVNSIPLKSPISKEVAAKAAWNVFGLSDNAEEASEVLAMLGLDIRMAMAGRVLYGRS